MPLAGISQPEYIILTDTLRLHRYNGNYAAALAGYRDPVVYQNSEGIFDEARIPDLSYIKGMMTYLDGVGELYYIEAYENGTYLPVGDVTFKPENPPIAIWLERYRGVGIGTQVMRTLIERLRALGYKKICGSTVYKWNTASLAMHRALGFSVARETENEYILELDLI